MPLNPDERPREFLVTLIGALRFALSEDAPAVSLDQAEAFVAEVEKRYGKIGPETEEKEPAP